MKKNLLNKRTLRSTLLVFLLALVCLSFLSGCIDKKDKDLADNLYQYKRRDLADEEKLTELAKLLKFSGGYEFESLNIAGGQIVYELRDDIVVPPSKDEDLDKEEPHWLSIRFKKNESRDPDSKEYPDFKVESSIFFALIEELDYALYIVQDSKIKRGVAGVLREDVDDMTISVLGMKAKELGKNKKNFRKLVEFYEEYMKDLPEADHEASIPEKPEKPLEPIKPGGQPELDEIINGLRGVKMTIKDGSLSEEGLTLILENNSLSNYIYKEEFLLQVKIDGKWEDLEIQKKGKSVFVDMDKKLRAKESEEVEVIWLWLYGSLESGNYRIVKRVFEDGRPGKDGIFYLGAEFEIE